MQKTITYTLSWEREQRSLRQQYNILLSRNKKPLAIQVFFVLVLAVVIESTFLKEHLQYLSLYLLAIIFGLMIRDYFQSLIISKKRLGILRNLEVSIELDEQSIRYITSNIQKHYSWEEIDSSLDTADILILQKQQIPVISLDKDLFDPETLSWIRQQVQAQKSPQEAST